MEDRRFLISCSRRFPSAWPAGRCRGHERCHVRRLYWRRAFHPAPDGDRRAHRRLLRTSRTHQCHLAPDLPNPPLPHLRATSAAAPEAAGRRWSNDRRATGVLAIWRAAQQRDRHDVADAGSPGRAAPAVTARRANVPATARSGGPDQPGLARGQPATGPEPAPSPAALTRGPARPGTRGWPGSPRPGGSRSRRAARPRRRRT